VPANKKSDVASLYKKRYARFVRSMARVRGRCCFTSLCMCVCMCVWCGRSWLYQYMAALAFSHERGVPYSRILHPALLLEGHYVTGLAHLLDHLPLDAAAAHCFSGVVEVMCAGDNMPLGNILYTPPEILLANDQGRGNRGFPSDVWVAACAIHHLYADLFLFPINEVNSEYGQLFEIFKLLGTPTEASYPSLARHAPHYCVSKFSSWSLFRTSLISRGIQVSDSDDPKRTHGFCRPSLVMIMFSSPRVPQRTSDVIQCHALERPRTHSHLPLPPGSRSSPSIASQRNCSVPVSTRSP
jgi:hypothetical protein